MIAQYAFFIDSASCSGCKTCQVACQDRSDLKPGHLWRRVYEIEGGSWSGNGSSWEKLPFSYFISMSCNHCESPSCVKACPTHAMHKGDGGLVTVNPETCMGCGYCSWACPYDAPRIDKSLGKMTKCDGCPEHLAAGKKPVCVTACPMRALDFGPAEEIRLKYGDDADAFPLPDHKITEPSMVIKQHKNAADAENRDGRISNREEVTDA